MMIIFVLLPIYSWCATPTVAANLNPANIDGLKNQSKRPHNIKNVKVTKELEKIILELRLNNRFGPIRIRFRLKRKYGVSFGTKTIYHRLKRHNLNVLYQNKKKIQAF